jgi:hypothetical protein
MVDELEPRNNADETRRQMPEGRRFLPGNSGRPKGSRNKLGEAFLEAMHSDFTEHGVAVIAKVREEKPDQYLKVIASILPKQMELNVNVLDDVSDDELAALVAAARAAIAHVAEARSGAGEADGAESSGQLYTVQ